jgi:pyridoxal phosphate enzyme (YggS family)
MVSVKENVERVVQRIRSAALRVGRSPEDVSLVAVTKTVGFDAIQEALACDVRIFGENRVHEAIPKIQKLGQNNANWHFVGHLQTNKARQVVGLFDLIHSVDTLRLAKALDTWINNDSHKTMTRQKVLIQVNISGESTKSGISPEGLGPMVKEMSRYKALNVVGLMTIPPPSDDPECSRPFFRILRELATSVEKEGIGGITLKELSMGMSADFEVAIEEGATLVRVGTAIFGQRN